jgi:hypothetical protein
MMAKLAQDLQDPARSGVYRAARIDEVVAAVRDSGLAAARIDLSQPVFEAFSQALGFPGWFGRNWDALEDCLTDLSWREAAGDVLLIERSEALAADERGTLLDVLAAAAEFWAGERRPFFAVFVGPAAPPALPLFPGEA